MHSPVLPRHPFSDVIQTCQWLLEQPNVTPVCVCPLLPTLPVL